MVYEHLPMTYMRIAFLQTDLVKLKRKSWVVKCQNLLRLLSTLERLPGISSQRDSVSAQQLCPSVYTIEEN